MYLQNWIQFRGGMCAYIVITDTIIVVPGPSIQHDYETLEKNA